MSNSVSLACAYLIPVGRSRKCMIMVLDDGEVVTGLVRSESESVHTNA